MKNFRVSLLLMLVCFIPFGIYAQTIELTGQVVDRDGEPVIGANIKIKGTTTGTITDLDGHFNLPVTSESILEVSYIGVSHKTFRWGKTVFSGYNYRKMPLLWTKW